MAQSQIRTLVVTTRPSLARPQSLIWPAAEPSEVADYYLDVTQPLSDIADSINNVVVDLKPSGAGEMLPTLVTVTGSVIGIWLSGGVPSRHYTVRIVAFTVGGRALEWLIKISVRRQLALLDGPILPPLNPGFCSPISWGSFEFDFSAPANSWLGPLV